MVADGRLAEEGGWGLNGGWCKAIDGSQKAVGGRWKPYMEGEGGLRTIDGSWRMEDGEG